VGTAVAEHRHPRVRHSSSDRLASNPRKSFRPTLDPSGAIEVNGAGVLVCSGGLDVVAGHEHRSQSLDFQRLSRPGRRADYAVLASLEESGPASQSELARRLAIDRGDLVGVIDRLDDDGLAVRRPDRNDRRRNAITITAAGRRTLADLQHDIEAAQEELLAPLEPAQRETLVALLQTLVDHHHSAGQEPEEIEGRPRR
jgi:DNA-binding MarR family transcriptional regulator